MVEKSLDEKETLEIAYDRIGKNCDATKDEIIQVVDYVLHSQDDLNELKNYLYLCVSCGKCCRMEHCPFLTGANFCSMHTSRPEICELYPLADVNGTLMMLLTPDCELITKLLTMQALKILEG